MEIDISCSCSQVKILLLLNFPHWDGFCRCLNLIFNSKKNIKLILQKNLLEKLAIPIAGEQVKNGTSLRVSVFEKTVI